MQHVDLGEWASCRHHTHRCSHCEFEWRVEPYTFGIGLNPLKEVDTPRAQLAQALKERDEAREALSEASDALDVARAAMEQFAAERDALRAAIEPTGANVEAYGREVAGWLGDDHATETAARAVLAAIAAKRK
jgi:hypothetical protein